MFAAILLLAFQAPPEPVAYAFPEYSMRVGYKPPTLIGINILMGGYVAFSTELGVVEIQARVDDYSGREARSRIFVWRAPLSMNEEADLMALIMYEQSGNTGMIKALTGAVRSSKVERGDPPVIRVGKLRFELIKVGENKRQIDSA